jgi:hypothetical protein
MKATVCAFLLCVATASAANPEKGPYTPKMSSDFVRAGGEAYPTALGARPWKTEDPAAYSGEFVDVANPALTVSVKVTKDRNGEWLADGEWKLIDLREHPQTVTWTRASMEFGTKHTYAYGGRGTLFIFFVNYRDPDAKDGEPRQAVLIGDHLFARK